MLEYFRTRGEEVPEEYPKMNSADWKMRRNSVLKFMEESVKHVYRKRFNKKVMTGDQFESLSDGEYAFIGGKVSAIKQIKDRKGGQMAFINVVDKNETYEIVAWSSYWDDYLQENEDDKRRPRVGEIVEIYGKVGAGRRGQK